MTAAYGNPTKHKCLGKKTTELPAMSSETWNGSTLVVTGPVADGFWVRAVTVMAHAIWARRAGLPVAVQYRSARDAYINKKDKERDGWSQFFEPLKESPSSSDDPPLMLQLDCFAAARAWEAFGNYVPTWKAAALQRAQRIEMVKSLPIRPKSTYQVAANRFWYSKGLKSARVTLGVHLRGTDKPGASRLVLRRFVPMIKAYLCHNPDAHVFVATDDARLLAELQVALAGKLDPSRLIWRADAIRGNSSLNPGYHAQELGGAAPSLAKDVLLDTLLLSKCDFLIKSMSFVSEFAIYFSPRLHELSYDVKLSGHPEPSWLNACKAQRLSPPPSPPPPPAPSGGHCSAGGHSYLSEQRAFHEQCATEIKQYDSLLAKADGKRGLRISWLTGRWGNQMGAGHVMPLLYWIHELCFRLERHCHTDLDDSGLSRYFRYAGEANRSWAEDKYLLERYPRPWGVMQEVQLEDDSAGRAVPLDVLFRERLFSQLANRNEPLLRLKIIGRFPESELPRMRSASLDACVNGTRSYGAQRIAKYAMPTPCLCRYVTEPWVPPAHLTGAPVAMHMRTGYADLSDAVLSGVRTDLKAQEKWFEASCGADPFGGDARRRYLLTDAPGLALALQQRFPERVVSGVSAAEYAGRSIEQTRAATRSWKAPPEVHRQVYDDIVVAGWSSELQVATQRTADRNQLRWRNRAFGTPQMSRFWIAIAARSMCLESCQPRIPHCERYEDVFFRDLPLLLQLKNVPNLGKRGWNANISKFGRLPDAIANLQPQMAPMRWKAMQAEMPEAHPCKGRSIPYCVESFASALTPLGASRREHG